MKIKNTRFLLGSDFKIALASSGAGGDDLHILETALAFEVNKAGKEVTAPDWVQILPKGPELATNDGRSFKLSDAQALVDAIEVTAAKPILVDYDHLSTFDPENNGDSTAAGWIEELEIRDGEVWARVVWTVRAAKQIAEREWRYLSPEFQVNKKTNEIAAIGAVSLVNRPAFEMTALARSRNTPNGDIPMLKEIAKALGLPENADVATILAAIKTNDDELTTARASQTTPSTTEFMPRADYDVVLARATKAEGDLKTSSDETRKSEVETMIASAVKAGKIAPASKDHYIALAMGGDDGFDQVTQLCATLPTIADASDLDDAGTGKSGLSAEDKEMAANLGVSEDDYSKELAKQKK